MNYNIIYGQMYTQMQSRKKGSTNYIIENIVFLERDYDRQNNSFLSKMVKIKVGWNH